MTITNKAPTVQTTYQSEYFKIRYQCDSDKDGYIVFDYLQEYISLGASANEIRIDLAKGIVVCTTTPQGATQTWSISSDIDGFFDMNSLTQNGTHLSVSLSKPYFAESQVSVYLKVQDSNGLTYDQTTPFNLILSCVKSSTFYTFLPDSLDGMQYTQTFKIHPSASTPQFVYRDPINNLALTFQDTNCVIQTRVIYVQEIQPDNTNLTTSSFGAPVEQGDGTFKLQYRDDQTLVKEIEFKIRITDKGGNVVWVEGLKFNNVCVVDYSNNVTSGPYAEAKYESMTLSGFQHEMAGFTETGVGDCLIDAYEVTDLTIKVYNYYDEMIGNTTEVISVTVSSGKLQLQFPFHGDSKRVYTFKVQGKSRGNLLHTTDEITVNSFNLPVIIQPQNATFVNQTGTIFYTIPKENFKVENIQIINYTIENFTAEILHEDGNSLGFVEDTFSLNQSGSLLNLTIPFHCDFARSYTFTVKTQADSSLFCFSQPISIISINNQSLDLSDPLNLAFLQYSSSFTLDFSKYFIHSQPGCQVHKMHVKEIWNAQTKKTTKAVVQIDEKNVLRVIDSLNFYEELQGYVETSFQQEKESETDVFSFNALHLFNLEIVFVNIEKPFSTNVVPQFDPGLENFKFEVTSDNDQFEFVLPPIFDEDPSTVTIDVVDGFDSSFMTFEDGQFLFDRFSKKSNGVHSMKLRLTDFEGQFKEYTWDVTIEYLVEKDDLMIVFVPQTQEEEINQLWVSVDEEAEVEVQEQREPITIKVQKFNANGMLTLEFSEELFSLEHYGLNLTSLNENLQSILKLQYKCSGQSDEKDSDSDEKFPELVNYKVQNFTGQQLIFILNFNNPLSVSSYGSKDRISITFKANKLFSSVVDSYSLASNYTLSKIEVPTQMASKEDFEQIVSMGSNTQNSMLLTLVIPFFFMIFMSASMHRVWSFYNMLQLSTNLINYNNLSIPANQTYIIRIIKNVTYFSLFKNDYVQKWLEKYIFGNARALQNIIFGQGQLITCFIFFASVMVFVAIGLKVKCVKQIAQRVKDKVVWSSFFRGSIQMCLPTALMMFGMLKTLEGNKRPEDEEEVESRRLEQDENYEWLEMEFTTTDYIMLIVNLCILFLLPLFSYQFLLHNQHKLDDPDFKIKYSTLYKELKLDKSSVYKHASWFILRRLFLSFLTVYLNKNVVLHIYANLFTSLFFINYLFKYNPYSADILNHFEKMNEFFTILLNYSLLFYSDYLQDPVLKYQIGWQFVYLYILISFMNITLVFIDLIKDVYLKTKKLKNQTKWERYHADVDRIIRFIIYNCHPEIKRKEVKKKISEYKNLYCFAELEEKVKEIFEMRERINNDKDIDSNENTLQIEEKEDEPNLQEWHLKTRNDNNQMLIVDDLNSPEVQEIFSSHQIVEEIKMETDIVAPLHNIHRPVIELSNLIPLTGTTIKKVKKTHIQPPRSINLEYTKIQKSLATKVKHWDQFKDKFNKPQKSILKTWAVNQADSSNQGDSSSISHVSLDEEATVTALRAHRLDYQRKQLLCKNILQRQQLEQDYRVIQQRIINDEELIQTYIQQNGKVTGPEAVQKHELNKEFIKRKHKK